MLNVKCLIYLLHEFYAQIFRFFFQFIPQLIIDYDLIEVSNGKCLKLSSRQFIDTPLSEADKGKVSPRCFKEYTINGSEDGGYFAASVINSFPTIEVRAPFLNKFYQCLLYGQLPHKITKLVVCGDSDSGKSSWARIFFGLIPQTKIASITKEKTFGLSMLMDDTELVFIDEWGSDTMGADTAKSLLQGGWIVQSVKHQKPRTIECRAGMYLTCNELPDFGDDQQHVAKRIAVYETVSLQDKVIEAPKWIEDHAMNCVVWILNQINSNIQFVPKSELFYEKKYDEYANIYGTKCIPSDDLQLMKKFQYKISDTIDYAVPVDQGLSSMFTDIPLEESDLNNCGNNPGPSGMQRSMTIVTTSITGNNMEHVPHLARK